MKNKLENDYYYIYKDIFGRWNTATNMSFIAEHPNCKAIPKSEVKNISTYISNLNK